MKKALAILLFLVALTISAMGQATTEAKEKKSAASSGNAATEQKLTQMEKELWDAWKNKDTAPFKKLLAVKTVNVGSEGVAGTDQVINEISKSDCQVTSYSIEQPQFHWFDKNTVMMAYKANQDAVCGGKKIPAAVWASSVWVNQGGQWKAATHQETTATK